MAHHMVALTVRDLAAARDAEYPDLYAKAYALRHAYKQVPKGFLHDCDRIQAVRVH